MSLIVFHRQTGVRFLFAVCITGTHWQAHVDQLRHLLRESCEREERGGRRGGEEGGGRRGLSYDSINLGAWARGVLDGAVC